VYSMWQHAYPQFLYIPTRHGFRHVVGIKEDMVDCDSAGRSDVYPIVFEGLKGRVELFSQFGIEVSPTLVDEKRTQLPELRHKCFYIGDGHIEMALTEETFALYKKYGFNLNNLCMVLTSGQIRFDPETGKRLPTYVIDDKIDITDELPFYAPPCFARGRLTLKQFDAEMNPLGCKVNYHPWSGRPLNTREKIFFTKVALLIAGGEAGDAQADSQNFAADPNRRASHARIEAVKSQIPLK
jgi:hypothetical protein